MGRPCPRRILSDRLLPLHFQAGHMPSLNGLGPGSNFTWGQMGPEFGRHGPGSKPYLGASGELQSRRGSRRRHGELGARRGGRRRGLDYLYEGATG
jgi:hypothetical protein